MITTFFGAAVVGLGIGILSGLLGIGGGMIMVPVFRLAFGMSAVASTATSLFTIIPTSISGVIAHVRGKTCVPKLGIALGIGGACTSPLGVWLAQLSPSWLVMLAVALVIAFSALTMLRKALKAAAQPERGKAGKPAAGDAPRSDCGDSKFFALSRRDLLKAVGIGALAGMASGYVGLGGGFLMVPLMLSLLDMPMKQASGTSLIAVMILATPAAIMQCLLGNVGYLIGVAVACGSIPGAAIGARLVNRVPEKALRFAFAGFLGVAAVLLVVNEFGLIG